MLESICIFGAAREEIEQSYKDEAYELSMLIAKANKKIVFGAGSTGIMGAVARGAKDNGAYLIGVVPNHLNDSGLIYDKCDQLILTETLRERKRIMDENADAFIAMPGGVGTLEELMEIITLKQLKRHEKPIIVLNVNGYYEALFKQIEIMINENFLICEDIELYHVANSAKEAMDYLLGKD